MNKPAELYATHLRGDHFAIQIGHHTVFVDQPIDNGGTDLAPNPTELFVGSYAGCVAFYARRFLARHELEESVQVTASWTTEDRPHRIGAIDITIAAEVPPELQARFMAVVEGCTVGNTLASSPETSIRVVPPKVSRHRRRPAPTPMRRAC